MPKSSLPFLVNSRTISLGERRAVIDADLIGLTLPERIWNSLRDLMNDCPVRRPDIPVTYGAFPLFKWFPIAGRKDVYVIIVF